MIAMRHRRRRLPLRALSVFPQPLRLPSEMGDHMQLKIGKTPDSTTSIAFRPHFFDTLRALPEIAKSIND